MIMKRLWGNAFEVFVGGANFFIEVTDEQKIKLKFLVMPIEDENEIAVE